jgi:hypothetical protein
MMTGNYFVFALKIKIIYVKLQVKPSTYIISKNVSY